MDAEPVDLTEHYGKVAGTEGDNWFTHPDWNGVPKGLQNFGGVLFDVSGSMLLRSTEMPHLKERHRIPVTGKYNYVHVLHGIGYADPDGTQVAKFVLDYGGAERCEFPIVYGEHVRDWWQWPSEKVSALSDPDSAIAWSAPHPSRPELRLRLCRTTFENPFPDKPIQRIEFVSMNRRSVLCVVAVSVGNEKPKPARKSEIKD